MKPIFIATLLGVLWISGCMPLSDRNSSNYPKYGSSINKSTIYIPLKPATTVSSSYNGESSILDSNKCLAYKKQRDSHEIGCQKHYDNRNEINSCVIRRLIENNFTLYEHEYCGK